MSDDPTPNPEQAETDPPKADPPQTDQPQTDQPQTDQPQPDPPRTAEERPDWDDRARPPARRHRGDDDRRRQLPPEDPYWQFGMPVESWGSSVRRGDGPRKDRGPRGYLECRACGVKVERKPRQRGASRCPMCGRNMRLVTPE